jgi:hypothetical protein
MIKAGLRPRSAFRLSVAEKKPASQSIGSEWSPQSSSLSTFRTISLSRGLKRMRARFLRILPCVVLSRPMGRLRSGPLNWCFGPYSIISEGI